MKNLYCLIAGVIIGLFIRSCTPEADFPAGSDQPEAIEWINGGGDIVSSLRGSEAAFANVRQDIIDSLAKIYNTRIKHILNYAIIPTQGDSELKPDSASKTAEYFPPVDSCPPQIKNLRQIFSSNYYTADVQIGDSSFMNLQSFDTVTVLWKRVKEGGLFNRKSFVQIDVSNANPDVRVVGIQAYKAMEKKTKFGIGVHAGYGISTSLKPSPYIGIGIHYSLIKF